MHNKNQIKIDDKELMKYASISDEAKIYSVIQFFPEMQSLKAERTVLKLNTDTIHIFTINTHTHIHVVSFFIDPLLCIFYSTHKRYTKIKV